jgi:hypothetical protein
MHVPVAKKNLTQQSQDFFSIPPQRFSTTFVLFHMKKILSFCLIVLWEAQNVDERIQKIGLFRNDL